MGSGAHETNTCSYSQSKPQEIASVTFQLEVHWLSADNRYRPFDNRHRPIIGIGR